MSEVMCTYGLTFF